jgi:hypothetical protein
MTLLVPVVAHHRRTVGQDKQQARLNPKFSLGWMLRFPEP